MLRRPSRISSLIMTLAALSLTACGRSADTPESTAETPPAQTPGAPPAAVKAPVSLPETATAIEAKARTLDAIEGEAIDGEVTIRYRAYVDETGQLIFVDEELMAGDYGATRDRYYFVDERLAYFYREGSQLVAMPPDPPGLGDVVMYLTFEADGSTGTREKRLKGRPVEMERFEVGAVTRRADELQKIAAYALAEPLGEDEYAGYVVFKAPLSTFQPCGETRIYWLSGEEDIVAALREAYTETLGDAAGEAAYARLVGSIEDPIREGAASNYPAVFSVREQTALAKRSERDCP